MGKRETWSAPVTQPEAKREQTPTEKRQKIRAFFFRADGGRGKNFWFRKGVAVVYLYVLPKHYGYLIFLLSLRMELEIHNRIKVGFAIGWSYYSRDREFDYSEVTIYLGLIGLKITY